MPDGYLYFMQRQTGGPIKIGVTNNLERRLADIRNLSGYDDLIIRLSVWSQNVSALERDLHYALRAALLEREWFEDCELVTKWMADIAAGKRPERRTYAPIYKNTKIAASLNPEDPSDAYLLNHLPVHDRSRLIKDALEMWFRVQNGDWKIAK